VLIDAYQSFVTGVDWITVISQMNDYVKNMHHDSGFMAEWNSYIENPDMPSFDHANVVEDVFSWLSGHGLLDQPNTFEMCGNTISFDRKMLEQDLPLLENWFFHRNIDVSSLKQLCKRHNPRVYEHWQQIKPVKKPHRALLDIAVSVKEYRHYVDNFLWVAK
jgi:oligoribonuclease